MNVWMKIASLVVVVGSLAACYSFPPPEVVKQSSPSPLAGATSFVVAPVTFNGFTYAGQPEAEWLKTRDPKQIASWQNDKVTMSEKVMKRFSVDKSDEQTFVFNVPPAAGQFVVAINFDSYDGQMRWTAEIRDSSGQVVDVVRDPHAVKDAMNTWMAEQVGATMSALMISKYLHSRAFPGKT